MFKNLKNGLIQENPVFSLFLGMCSTLAISTSFDNALGMGICLLIVLTLSNILISLIRKITPDEIRIPVYIVIIATLVSIVEMLVHAYTPSLYISLGSFLGLLVVNCIILGRAEAFASKNNVFASMIDGISMSLGYTFALIIISTIREFISTASITFSNPFNPNIKIFSINLEFLKPYTISIFSSPLGAFLTFACIAAFFAYLKDKTAIKEK